MDHTYIRAYLKHNSDLEQTTRMNTMVAKVSVLTAMEADEGRSCDEGAAAAPLLPVDEDCRRRLPASSDSDRRPRTDENGGLRPAVRVEGVYRGGFCAGGDANSPAEFSAAPRELPSSPIECRGCRRDGESAREEKREKRNGHGSLETADSAIPMEPGLRVLYEPC